MNIAIYVSPFDSVPAHSDHILAPWTLADALIKGLAPNHNVITYCAEGSVLPDKVIDLGIQPMYQIDKNKFRPSVYFQKVYFQEERLASQMIRNALAGDIDCIHVFQGTLRILPILQFSPVPVLCTIHDPFFPEEMWMYTSYLGSSTVQYVAISQSHKKGAGSLPVAGVVYNGLDVSAIPFSANGGERLLMIGRIRAEKGFHTGIAVCKALHKQLLMVGERFPDNPQLDAYWKQQVEPHVDNDQITFDSTHKKGIELWETYAQSKALLFPIQWEEPFGMVLIESMACGTPVVGFARGSVPEVVVDGMTGFLVNPSDDDIRGNFVVKKTGVEGINEALQRLYALSPEEYGAMRTACRDHVEANFTTGKMVTSYETVYKSLGITPRIG